MIDALVAQNIIAHQGGLSAVCGPVIFSLEAAARDVEQLEEAEMPHPVYCRLEVGESSLDLVGFSHPDRRELYLLLRTVRGIGRRSALMILDCGEVRDTLRAVAGADQDYFSGIPGLGAKRIDAVLAALGKAYQSLPNPLPLPVSVWVEARDSLTHSGEANAEEQLMRAVEGLDDLPQSAEELVALVEKG